MFLVSLLLCVEACNVEHFILFLSSLYSCFSFYKTYYRAYFGSLVSLTPHSPYHASSRACLERKNLTGIMQEFHGSISQENHGNKLKISSFQTWPKCLVEPQILVFSITSFALSSKKNPCSSKRAFFFCHTHHDHSMSSSATIIKVQQG